MEIKGKAVNKMTVEIDGVDYRDYPDFCDAHFSYAEFEDGTVLTDNELTELNDCYGEVVSDMAFGHVNSMADFA